MIQERKVKAHQPETVMELTLLLRLAAKRSDINNCLDNAQNNFKLFLRQTHALSNFELRRKPVH